ncbi:protein of unknown function [Paraburkholderia kururiensis]
MIWPCERAVRLARARPGAAATAGTAIAAGRTRGRVGRAVTGGIVIRIVRGVRKRHATTP